MRKIVIVYDGEAEYKYESILEMIRKRFSVERLCVRDGISLNEYNDSLSKCSKDYICSLDMAGFQLNTLLDYPAYDVMREKQMHIIIDEVVFPLYAEDDFGLHMFFYMPGDAKKWKSRYPHIPNIDAYERLEEDAEGKILASKSNERIINAVIDGFLREVEG